MLARVFRSNQPGVLVLLLVLVPALFLPNWWAAAPDLGQGMPLMRWLAGSFKAAGWTYCLAVMLWVAVMAVQVAFLLNETELVDRRNHLSGLLVPLALALSVPAGGAGAAFFGLPLVIWSMHRTWSISTGHKALGALFDAGLLLGAAAQFYMPYAFLLVVVWASVSVIRPFQWREYIVPFVGVVLVFYLAWGVQRLADIPDQAPLRTIIRSSMGFTGAPAHFGWIVSLVLVPLLVVASLRFAEHYGRGVVREQNIRSAFIAFGLTMALLGVLVQLIGGRFPVVLVAVPLAVLTTFALIGTRRAWLGELAVACLLLFAIWLQYGGA
ncbi:MAG TPA: hypothetical protein PLR96_06905 [Flavobacteriales bacterium]|nr:hypothetical protein [Flavobacteriales bacterium]